MAFKTLPAGGTLPSPGSSLLSSCEERLKLEMDHTSVAGARPSDNRESKGSHGSLSKLLQLLECEVPYGSQVNSLVGKGMLHCGG